MMVQFRLLFLLKMFSTILDKIFGDFQHFTVVFLSQNAQGDWIIITIKLNIQIVLQVAKQLQV